MLSAIPEKKFLSVRINNTWNALEEDTRAAESLLKFKKRIDSELSDKEYEYNE